jgi:protein-S-isoprenylcysteine O-methyltransferase Ste14
MVESLFVTALPALFLIVLFGGGALMRRRGIDMDGTPPIDKRLYTPAKYSILLLWGVTAAAAWGAHISFFRVPGPSRWVALAAWTFGFLFMFAGRFGLGLSFRIGSPIEATALRTGGLFGMSRNPMYVGLYATILGAVLYTLNPVVLAVAIFVIAVHHRIVLAEERFLSGAFGEGFADYCCRVRRYI